MHISRFFKRIGLFGLCSLLIWLLFSSRAAPVATASDIRLATAAGDLQLMAAHDTGPTDLTALLNDNATRSLSLATADLDEDGILDVIAGYGVPGGAANPGLLSIQRGNAAAIYRHGAVARSQQTAGTFTSSFLLPDKALTGLAESPDFLAAADFNGDGHADVLVGAAGSSMLYLLQGDGRGELAQARPIVLPGQLSRLLAGEFDAPDGLPEVVVSLEGPAGSRLALFASPQGALANADPPTLVPLPAPALDMTLDHFDGEARPSLVVLTGKQLLLVHGRASAAFSVSQGLPPLETRDLPFQAVALAAGNFSGAELEVAILAHDGRLFLASPHTPTSRSTWIPSSIMAQAAVGGLAELRPTAVSHVISTLPQAVPLSKWLIRLVSSATDLPPADQLVRVEGVVGDADGLAVITNNATLSVSAPTAQLLSLRLESDIVSRILPPMAAAISMRVSPDARHGLVYLSATATVTAPQVLLPVAGPTFTVNLTGDTADANPVDGLCDTDPATTGEQCTLRAAIIQANALGGPATIQFAIGSGLQKIAPTTQLPAILVPLTIDGTTQPGYTNAPLIQLSGEAQPSGSGLLIGNASTVRGLVIGNFQGNGILITGTTGGNIIENNYIGTDPTGTITNPNGIVGGVYSGIPAVGVFNSPNNTIGGTNAAARNLISGNSGSGIVLAEAGSHGNLLQGNYIGTDATGLAALGNGLNGAAIDCSTTPSSISGHDNVVGGLSAGAGNIISANQGAGVAIECTSANANLVQGNYIGTNYLGTAALNGVSPAAGVFLWAYQSGSVRNNIIGGSTSTARNIIAGNTSNGLSLAADSATPGISVTLNQVSGNYIGVNIAGAALPNQWTGIRLNTGAIDNLIGGSRPDLTCASPGNVISGNLLDGIALSGVQKNRVQGNCIGVGPDGVTTIANHQAGVVIDRGSTQNLIGGDRGPGACHGICNTIAGNVMWGIVLSDTTTLSNTLRANDIHGNGKLGIDLVGGAYDPTTGVTANRPDLVGLGPNGLTFFPVGVMGTYDPATNQTLISGILASSNPVSATIDLYASSQVDPSGFGGGEYYLGQATPHASGVFTFTVAGHLPKLFVSATATDENGATSEFGPVCGDPDGNGNVDDDGDGLCDDWEQYGIDFNGDGNPDLDLHTRNADPERKDIFIEADYMNPDKPSDAALKQVVDAFNNAPATNPAGQPDGIALHFVGGDPGGYLDEQVDYADSFIFFGPGGPGAYDDFKDIKLGSTGVTCGVGNHDAHFGTRADRQSPRCYEILGAKRLVMRYVLFANSFAEGPSNSGVANLPGSDFIVTIANRPLGRFRDMAAQFAGAWNTLAQIEYEDMQAGTLMHELGHTLGLYHGGAGTNDYNCKPNYLSVMNYLYQFNLGGFASNTPGVATNTPMRANRPLDFSRNALPNLIKNALSESDGIVGPTGHNTLVGRRALWGFLGGNLISPANGSFNWNHDTIISPGVLAGYYDINRIDLMGGSCPANTPANATPLTGYNDWSNLIYNFRMSDSYVQGANLPTPGVSTVEMDFNQVTDGGFGSSDFDQDGAPNLNDDCPFVANPAQQDSNGDNIGDACSLAAFDLAPNPAATGQIVTGTVTLVQAAPTDGAYLELAATPGFTTGLPLTMTIPVSTTQGQFHLLAPDVPVTTTVTVTASWAVHTLTMTLTIAPASLWHPVASMATKRFYHTATVLGDGTVLVVGGRSQFTMNNFAGPERYDPVANTWSPAGAMITKRAQHTATLLKSGDVLVVGGIIDQNGNGWAIASAELYHPVTNTWAPAGQMSVPRVGHSAILLPSGKVLVVGGRSVYNDSGSSLGSAELYDPATNTWSPAASMNVKRNDPSAVLLNSGRVLVAGGERIGAIGNPLSSAELYDPVANTWQPAGTLIDRRMDATVTLLPNGQVLLAGGWWLDTNPWNALDSAELYNPIANTWQAAAPMPLKRKSHTATLLRSGQVLLTGGVCWDCQTMATAVLYDPQLNKWRWAADMNQGRFWHAAVLLATGQVLVTGGTDGYVPLGSAEIYLPPPPVQPVRLLMYLPLMRR